MLPIVFILVYDAWLYWTHRALHRWAPRIHGVHHAIYGLTFDRIEHLVLWGPLVLAPLVGWAFAAILWGTVLAATLAIHRKMYNWLNLPWRAGLEVWITPHYHKVHHDGADGNYALFLTYWDRLAGTRVKEL